MTPARDGVIGLVPGLIRSEFAMLGAL